MDNGSSCIKKDIRENEIVTIATIDMLIRLKGILESLYYLLTNQPCKHSHVSNQDKKGFCESGGGWQEVKKSGPES